MEIVIPELISPEIAAICFGCAHFNFKEMRCRMPIRFCHSRKVVKWRKENRVN